MRIALIRSGQQIRVGGNKARNESHHGIWWRWLVHSLRTRHRSREAERKRVGHATGTVSEEKKQMSHLVRPLHFLGAL
jgi:hypothetical protein